MLLQSKNELYSCIEILFDKDYPYLFTYRNDANEETNLIEFYGIDVLS